MVGHIQTISDNDLDIFFLVLVLAVSYWFNASNPEVGGLRFIPLSNFRQPNMGFLVKDVCVVEAEVSVIGVANAFS